MKTKIFTLLLMLTISTRALFASIVQVDGIWYVFDNDKRTAIVTKGSELYKGSIIIPSLVTYDNKKFSVTSIGNSAFLDCVGLTFVTIPNSVTSIGNSAFSGCTGLTSMTIPGSVNCIEYRAFYGCKSLTSLVISEGVTHIKNEAFWLCNKLSTVTIPKSLVFVGDSYSAFNYQIIETINYTGSIADWCQKSWNLRYVSENYKLYIDGVLQQNVIIPDGITDPGSFRGCNSLISIALPNSITTIRNGTFYNCYNLKSITIPINLNELGSYVFAGCTSLTSVTWNVKKRMARCEWPFYKENEYNISKQIVSFTFGDEVECIPAVLCQEMTKLTSITIPNSVTFIQGQVFENCTGLTSVTIPSNVSIIYSNVFKGCSKLKEIIMLPETPPYDGGSMVDASVPIYVPCGTLEAYRKTSWSNYNIQYQPSPFKLSATSAEPHKGSVTSQVGNACEPSVLSALPNDNYYFVQWSDGITDNPRTITMTQDTKVSAIFGPFIVSFVNDNNTILSSQEYEYGVTPIPPTDPVKTNDAQYTYTFAGWSPQIVAVTSDATYKATYNSTINKYTITFVSEDSVLSADLWKYGTMPIYRGETPTKDEDEKYTYTFNGWSPEIVSVVADATYSATFTATEKTEAIESITGNSSKPAKYLENGNIYILMPNDKKYSIIGELVK